MNKILNIIDRIILILASVIFIILIGCISILPIAKSKSYYLKEQDRNKVEEILEKYTFNGYVHQHMMKQRILIMIVTIPNMMLQKKI